MNVEWQKEGKKRQNLKGISTESSNVLGGQMSLGSSDGVKIFCFDVSARIRYWGRRKQAPCRMKGSCHHPMGYCAFTRKDTADRKMQISVSLKDPWEQPPSSHDSSEAQVWLLMKSSCLSEPIGFPPSQSDFTVMPGWQGSLEQFSSFVPLNLMGPIYLFE